MSAPLPFERKLLSAAENHLDRFISGNQIGTSDEQRIQALEAAAARHGGYDLRTYHRVFSIDTLEPRKKLDQIAETLLDHIDRTGIPTPLALAALARERLQAQAQRKAGAHYTDYRLASHIGEKAAALNSEKRPIVDPASGSGILLAATVMATCGQDRKEAAAFLADSVIAVDVSATALRGARLALSSLTNDLGAIESMTARWYVGDSLLRPRSDWTDGIEHGFGVVVGNPPWEKLKVHRHEEALAEGVECHYGSLIDTDASDLDELRAQRRDYARELSAQHRLGSGEVDLFAAFTRLMADLAKDGAVSALLPAGLIRSKGTEELRRALFDQFNSLDVTVFDNKAKFFAIDTRFKFLSISGRTRSKARGSVRINLSHGGSSDGDCVVDRATSLSGTTLARLRPDMSIPEVHSPSEWRLFQKMSKRGQKWDQPQHVWYPNFCREVDMTRLRPRFLEYRTNGAMPLVEGRMVHQFRFGAKSYKKGCGRRAIWDPAPIGHATLEPQFWIRRDDLPKVADQRSGTVRAAFCDIAGQTNERSMMAAVIPADVACGNKVPTVLFENAPSEDDLELWCAMVNSFAFDWLLRRVLTTTVNYFLLQSVPLPPIRPGDLPARQIVKSVKRIREADRSGSPDAAQSIATERLAIDLICFRAYGLTTREIATVMQDFPSIDRSQTPLDGESRSTITRDMVIGSLAGPEAAKALDRYETARRMGAIGYVPSQVSVETAEASTTITSSL